MQVVRFTETGEAPWWQGAMTEKIGNFLKEEQRSQPGVSAARSVRGGVELGYIAHRMQWDLHHGLIG